MADVMSKGREVAEEAGKEATEAAKETTEAAKAGVEAAKAGEPTKGVLSISEQIPVETYLYATAGSILASLLLFLRNKENGIFVGLWAPTILNAALLYKVLKPSKGNV